MTPYKLGRKHAREMMDNLKRAGVTELTSPVYLDHDEIWEMSGPYTWDQYLKGAKSILGENMVRIKPRVRAHPDLVVLNKVLPLG